MDAIKSLQEEFSCIENLIFIVRMTGDRNPKEPDQLMPLGHRFCVSIYTDKIAKLRILGGVGLKMVVY